METGQPQASIAKNIFEGVIQFLPDWLEIPLLCLLALIIVLGWVQSIRGKIARRRAARTAQPVGAPQPVAASQGDQGRGADYLGPYAPAQPQAPQPPRQEPQGADFLGAYAPQQRRDGDSG
ncbi:hypothetical protein OG883_18025 [Streptomyces sp. NBC_01142]|uniref:hypothetical protein n=1 Tax=Streptomyces sp. NBC_01142 TaxID=2975865 RepID=UPI0022544A43|nr:hypothetical protein [Streptomyces sp. NBC_01142]MCX4821750.1 hypothetical protein [Streptomyces sp. NBC_01142]